VRPTATRHTDGQGEEGWCSSRQPHDDRGSRGANRPRRTREARRPHRTWHTRQNRIEQLLDRERRAARDRICTVRGRHGQRQVGTRAPAHGRRVNSVINGGRDDAGRSRISGRRTASEPHCPAPKPRQRLRRHFRPGAVRAGSRSESRLDRPRPVRRRSRIRSRAP
jgi:hypothetical protein